MDSGVDEWPVGSWDPSKDLGTPAIGNGDDKPEDIPTVKRMQVSAAPAALGTNFLQCMQLPVMALQTVLLRPA